MVVRHLVVLKLCLPSQIYPNHGVHFAGFIAGFFVTLGLLLLGVLAIRFTSTRERFFLLQQRV